MNKFFFGFIGIHALWALPQSPSICEGQVNCHFDSGKMEIRSSDRAIIEWKDFSIESGEHVQIVQPNSSSSLLNRVIDPYPSRLFGRLEANGQVILINPNGVLVGSEAQINTASFIASTFDLQNDCFLAAKELRFAGENYAAIENQGSIHASNGDLLLLGYRVDQLGAISAQNGMVNLVAMDQETILKPTELDRLYVRSNKFRDAENVYGNAFVSHQGTIVCQNSDGTGGTVTILGDHIWLKDGSVMDHLARFQQKTKGLSKFLANILIFKGK